MNEKTDTEAGGIQVPANDSKADQPAVSDIPDPAAENEVVPDPDDETINMEGPARIQPVFISANGSSNPASLSITDEPDNSMPVLVVLYPDKVSNPGSAANMLRTCADALERSQYPLTTKMANEKAVAFAEVEAIEDNLERKAARADYREKYGT